MVDSAIKSRIALLVLFFKKNLKLYFRCSLSTVKNIFLLFPLFRRINNSRLIAGNIHTEFHDSSAFVLDTKLLHY